MIYHLNKTITFDKKSENVKKLISLPPHMVDYLRRKNDPAFSDCFFTSDPKDKKLGSGGGTAWLLKENGRYEKEIRHLKTGLHRKLRIKSECNLPKNEIWVNSHLPVDATLRKYFFNRFLYCNKIFIFASCFGLKNQETLYILQLIR